MFARWSPPAIQALKGEFGHTTAKDFGPLLLKRYRQGLIERGLCRRYVNDLVGVVKKMFKWGASEELVPIQTCQALYSVAGLRRGRSEARENPPVKPVSEDMVFAIEPHVSPKLWAMVQLQLLTGMRPAEVKIMRTIDINMSGDVWEYRPAGHKTEHFGHEKVVMLGPQAQEVIRPWLSTDLEAYIFPARAGRPYSRDAYRQAIYRGCDRAFPLPAELGPAEGESERKWKARLSADQREQVKAWRREHRWHPHQLKHTMGTAVRRKYGVEAVKVVLGHRDIKTSEIYAERDLQRAAEIMAKIG